MVQQGDALDTYALRNDWTNASRRLSLLAQCLDPITQSRLASLGIPLGARCLEVGAGTGSTACFLADRVGARGHVIATDLDTRFLLSLEQPRLEVWQHDVSTDELPEAQFDLIHARWLLYHLSSPTAAVAKLARALRPGGALLLEDVDFFPLSESPSTDFIRYMEAVAAEVGARVGHDGHWAARRLPELLTEQGLRELNVDARVTPVWGGEPMARFWILTGEQVRSPLLESGRLSAAELERGLSLLADSSFWSYSTANVAASARR